MKQKFTNTKWMDFSGSPLIVLPENLKNVWKGFYSEENINNENEPGLIINQKVYYINDDFDFDNPKTDYDKICAIEKNHFTYQINNENIIVISSFYDIFGWNDDHKILINGKISNLNDKLIAKLDWKDKIEVKINTNKQILMNSCECLLNENLDDNDFQPIHLEKGNYVIESAEYSDEEIAILYRFTKQK